MTPNKLNMFLRNMTIATLLIVCFLPQSNGQASPNSTILVKGLVTSQEFPEGIPSVNIREKDTSNGTVSEFDGTFQIAISSKSSILVFSYIGYNEKEISIGNQTELILEMELNSEALDEVVIVGFGSQKKETVTGSIVSVSSRELTQSPTANISNSLGGRMPGLVSVQESGVPGGDAAVLRIRGIGTLNPGAESAPLILVDGVVQNSLNTIDPNEIENVSVLKDASATAVYGVRGANGVILVTTKRGEIGKPRLNFTSNTALSTPTRIPQWIESYDFAVLWNEALVNEDLPTFFREGDIEKFRDGSDPLFFPQRGDYSDFIDNPALQQQYNLNVSGGTKSVKYFISGGFFDQNSVFTLPELDEEIGFEPRPNYRRYNLRSNFDIQINKNLELGINLGGVFDLKHNTDVEVDAHLPFTGPGIYDGKLISGYRNDPLDQGNVNRGYSVYREIYDQGFSEEISNQFSINTALNYNFDRLLKGLSFRSRVAYTNYYDYYVERNNSINSYALVYDEGGEHFLLQTGFDGRYSFSESYGKYRRYYMETGLEYERQVGNHNFTGLVLYNQSKLHDPGLQYSVPSGYLGVVGRATYNYKLRYLAEFNVGYNGSENFAKGNRFGLFPAYSLGWVITEEPIFPKNNVLTYMKIRASYGEVGNDKLGGDRFLYLPPVYQYPATYWLDNGYYFGQEGVNLQNYIGATEGAVGNPDITWEIAKKYNLGIDLSLFNKVSAYIDLFSENRDNILWVLAIAPGIVGSDLVPGNIGQVSNKGAEFQINYDDNIGQVKFNIGANYSFARNKILYKAEPEREQTWLNETGFSVNQYTGYKNEGFYNYLTELENRPYYNLGGNDLQRGDIVSVDVDGNGIVDESDVVPVGYNELPEVFFGITGNISYKGFDFSFLFQGADNFYTDLSGSSAWAFSTGLTPTLAQNLERWNEERFNQGLPITQPRVMDDGGSGVNTEDNEFYIVDRSYIRFKNAELGYTFNPGFTRKYGIDNLRIYSNGVNLHTWSKLGNFDPESPDSGIYPVVRTFNFGLKLSF